MRTLAKLSLILAVVTAGLAFQPGSIKAFPSFSLDPGSPSSGALPPGGILDPATGAPTGGGAQGVPVVAIAPAALGVPGAGNIDDISYGDDMALFTGIGAGALFLQFSVAPGAVGGPWLPGGAYNVFTQGIAGEDAAPGDIFTTTVPAMPPPFGVLGCGMGLNAQLYDPNGANVFPVAGPAPGLGGLVDPAGVGADDNIDAYELLGPGAVDYQTALSPPLSGADGLPDAPVFFTVDAGTALMMGVSPADVLVTDASSATGWSIYATEAALGLMPGDDIAALLVADSATLGPGPGGVAPPPRMFGPHPTDFVAFSLQPGSPSLGAASALPPVCAAGPKYPGDVWGVSLFVGGLPFAMFSAEGLGVCSPRVGACAGAMDGIDAMDINWAMDADADGAPDALEIAGCAAVGPSDTDGDGLPDSIEMVLSTNPVGPCTGLPSPAMPDSDLDMMIDSWEIAYWLPGCLATNPSIADPATDADGDGVTNIVEYGQNTSPCNVDSDGDGFWDLQPTAHEGPANTAVTNDNCPNVANPGQTNTDGNFIDNSPPFVPGVDDKTLASSDAMGDDCDTDDDNDGLADTTEMGPPFPCMTATGATNPLMLDTDGDKVTDGAECAMGSDPVNPVSKPAIPPAVNDPDGDLLSTAFEMSIGTNPAVKDTDGDGLNDGIEVKGYGSNPLVVNTDGDASSDACEAFSLNGDTKVTSADQGMLASEMLRVVPPPPPKLANMDLNKDGPINSADQGLMASKVGKCP